MVRRPGSIKLADIAGIRIGVDVSWFFVLFLTIYVLSVQFRQILDASDGVAYLTAVASALLFFASIVLHELGHAFVSRRQGVKSCYDGAFGIHFEETAQAFARVTPAEAVSAQRG